MSDWTQLTYTPGRWVAVATAEQWLLVDLAAEDPVVRRCWKLMSEAAGVDAVLDSLLAGGLAGAPGFALASLRDGERRVVSRFPAVAVLHRSEADREVAGTHGVSWADELIDGPLDGLTLRGLLSTDSTVELPMGAGVFTAGVVHVAPGTPATRPVGPADSTVVGPIETTQPATAEPAATAAEPAPAAAEPVVEPVAGVAAEPSIAAAVEPVIVAAVEPVADVADAAPVADDADAAPSYDFLFGATARPEDSVRVDLRALTAEPTAAGPPAAGPVEATLVPPPATVLPPSPAVEPAAPGGGLIDAVPWLDPAGPATTMPAAPMPAEPRAEPPAASPERPAAPEPPAPTSEPPRRDTTATVSRAELARLAAAGAAGPTGPTVLAGYCPAHHLSPPHAARCRVCSAPMPQQAPFEIARPALGVLRLQTGELITLDRGVVLGRSPEVPDVPGAERPHVVRLASPDNDISRTHAEVLLDGWNVYVRDFGSVNGTVVTLPGRPPERLRDNSPLLLEHGARITLADEVSCTFEVTP